MPILNLQNVQQCSFWQNEGIAFGNFDKLFWYQRRVININALKYIASSWEIMV